MSIDARPILLRCPCCGAQTRARVVDTRGVSLGGFLTVRRRRECTACGGRWNTLELREPARQVAAE